MGFLLVFRYIYIHVSLQNLKIPHYFVIKVKRMLPNNNLILCNMFWRANLTCHVYEHGNPKVNFDDLWPSACQISALLECVCDDERQRLTSACCKFVLRCGPVRILQALIEQNLINLDHVFDDGESLLHVACLASNIEAVTCLLSQGSSLKASDKRGQTLDQQCYSSHIRKELPTRYQASINVNKKQKATLEDKQLMFNLLDGRETFEELQIMLQTVDFDVNQDKDSIGDLLIHNVVRQGLTHLALLLNLVLVHKADVEAIDHKGMTPLCIAAYLGFEIITEVVMCLLGADPNGYSNFHQWTPLHFAARKSNISVIQYLARRGANLNIEDEFGLRAEDIAQKLGHYECKGIIESLRLQRCEHLSYLAKEGNLTPQMILSTDLFAIDSEGFTLVMKAAQANRCDNLMVLLHHQKCPIDAQHIKCGQTAVSLAAVLGKSDAVQTLLRYGAHPGIGDMSGMLPLHYACRNNHVLCTQSIVNAQNGLTGLSKAFLCTYNHEVCNIIKEALLRRQKNIVNPTLFECAMNGDADRLYSTLEEGDDVNPLTGTGDWPMYMAVGNNYINIMHILYVNGGDIYSHHQTTGSTVLHTACSRGLYDIVSYLLNISKARGSTTSQSNNSKPYVGEFDINALNYQGKTALQITAEKGYSRIVKLLLSNGASSALIDSQGQLYKCCEFEGVQVLLERNQQSRTEQIMSYIKTNKKFHHLTKMWKGKFDHNLRNSNGDTPLMFACLYGKTQVVKFLLISAIQSMEKDGKDFEKSMQSHGEKDYFVDSGAFDEFHPGYKSSEKGSLKEAHDDCTELETSVTDFSDQEIGSDRSIKKESDKSSTLKGFSSSVNLPSTCRYEAKHSTMFHSCSYESGSVDHSADANKDSSSHTLKQTTSSTRVVATPILKGWKSTCDLVDNNTAYNGFSTINIPRIYQGTCVNHLFAVNMRDGCTAIHRAVECIDEKKGLFNLHLLMAKDSYIINLPNFDGLTPLHYAVKMERKLILKKLLNMQCVNLNLRTTNGKLAENMSRSKKIAHLIQDARQSKTEHRVLSSTNIKGLPTPPRSSVEGTSIDFDTLEERFKQLRK